MKRIIKLMLVALTLTVLFYGYASEKGEAKLTKSPAKKNYVFGMTVMCDASFFDAVKSGVLSITDKHGDKVIYVAGKLDAGYQQSVIEDFIAQKVDLVLYNPADSKASLESLKMLKEAGIPIINFDSKCADASYIQNYTATDNYKAGEVTAEFMMKEHPEGGTVAIIDFPAAESAVLRANGFADVIKSAKNWKIIERLDGTNTADGALKVCQDIITAHPKLTAMFSINDEMGLSAYSAIKASGLKIDLYSINGGPESKDAMKKDGKKGIWRASAAQSPIVMGKTIAEFAYKVLSGKKIEKETLIKPFIICPANIDKYGKNNWQ